MNNSTTPMDREQPFKPSLVDRFNDWVRKLPISDCIFFLALGLGLIGVQMLFLWLEGGLQEVELVPIIIFNGLITPFLLALIQLLDNQAATALTAMRPMLDTTESEFDECAYRLSTMPAPQPLVVGLTALILVILMEQLWTVPVRYGALAQLPVFRIVYWVIDKSSAFLFGVIIYHTIRQLRLVNAIHAKHLRINLFNIRPSQAFSSLTASTAVGLTVGVYGWMLINPDLFTDPVSFGFTAAITILAMAVFVWPLYGVHRRMKEAKERALHEIDLRFEAVFSKLDAGLRDGDFWATERLSGTIASLEIQHNRIAAIPIWPWRSEAARFVLGAIALPIFLTILQFFV